MAKQVKQRDSFPSQRQAGCAGLRLKYYPAYVRDMVDVDYADKLGEADKVWLASFLEEHYRGWRLKGETQVHPVGMIRAANAAHHRRRRGFEPVEFVTDQERGDGFSEDVLIEALDSRRRGKVRR